MSTHEIHPPKGPLERVLCRLSTKTAALDKEGGSGRPEFTASDMAAVASGLSDRIARELPGVMLEDAQAVNHAVQELDLWGWLRWRNDWPDRQMTGALHGRLAAAAVANYQQGGKGYAIRDIREYLKISGRRFIQLTPHWCSLERRLIQAEGELVQHVRRHFRREVA